MKKDIAHPARKTWQDGPYLFLSIPPFAFWWYSPRMTEFALNHSRFCFWICLSLLLVLAGIRPACAQTDAEFFLKPPDGILIVGFRETATHRPEPQLLRPSHYHGLHESIDLWIHVDPQGRVLEVRGFDKTKFDSKEVIDAARRIQYSPFLLGRTADIESSCNLISIGYFSLIESGISDKGYLQNQHRPFCFSTYFSLANFLTIGEEFT